MRRGGILALGLSGWMVAALSAMQATVNRNKRSLTLEGVDTAHPATDPELWERVIAKLRAGAMPPPGVPRPDAKTYETSVSWLEREIDRAWVARPSPGRSSAVQRLNRTE